MNAPDIKVKTSLANLERALNRLGEALAEPEENPLRVDAVIQRFEFAWEIFWKSLKRILAQEGIETHTPREALKKAFAAYWLKDETVWLNMLKDRNTTSHVYDEAVAKKIVERINDHYYGEMRQAQGGLTARFGRRES
ncbi:MAG: nucleotidyltransferase substrate binding protein [Magnetococcales bacterium]|nr:nucleotidyltransferase substrate binding protein [Magnetococcales bacterium]